MTREAKIGMLTGLGVIVAIGVLLSEYLGDGRTGAATAAGVTGQMAPLPVGAAYREQVLSPISVPAMTPAGGGERRQLAGGGVVASPIGMPTMYAAADAGNSGGTGPVLPSVMGPVAPIPVGPTLMNGGGGMTGPADGPPTIRLADMTVARPAADQTVKASATTYVIVHGDTLAKIARKFYGSSKNSDVDRIVKANPNVLKNAGSTLLVNTKLTIPNVPAPAAAAAAPAAPRPMDPGMVGIPGGEPAVPLPGVVQPPRRDGTPVLPQQEVAKARTYVVQSGDTLERIARKLAPTKVSEMVSKLASLNGIKDPSKLQAGQTLKLPA